MFEEGSFASFCCDNLIMFYCSSSRWSFYLHVHLSRAFTRIVAYHRPDTHIFYHRLEMDLISSFFCKLNFTNFRIIFGISCTDPSPLFREILISPTQRPSTLAGSSRVTVTL